MNYFLSLGATFNKGTLQGDSYVTSGRRRFGAEKKSNRGKTFLLG
jgi:hypothetical protein